MTIYISLIMFLLIIGLWIKPDRTTKKKKYYMWIAFLILMILSAGRNYNVGADTKEYISLFEMAERIHLFNSRYEVGFMIYIKLLHAISSEPIFFLLITSSICIGTVCYFIYLYSPNSILSILLYILLGGYFSQMNIIRQELALAISILGFIALMKQRKIVSAILLYVASNIHTVGVVVFIPYIIYILQEKEYLKKRNVKNSLKWITFFAIVAFLAYSIIMTLITIYFPQYVNYFKSEWGESNYVAALFKSLIHIVFLLVGAIYFKNKTLNKIEQFSLLMIGMAIIFSVLSMRMEIWNRVLGMFSIYTSIIWAPLIIENIEERENRLIVQSSIFICSFLYMIIVLVFRPEWSGVVPYRFGN